MRQRSQRHPAELFVKLPAITWAIALCPFLGGFSFTTPSTLAARRGTSCVGQNADLARGCSPSKQGAGSTLPFGCIFVFVVATTTRSQRGSAARHAAKPDAAGAKAPESYASSPAGAKAKAPASYAAKSRASKGPGAVGKVPTEEWSPSREKIGQTAPLGFFDPIGIAPADKAIFFEYRACEIKHGRVAMLACLGSVVQHYIRLPGFERTTYGEPMPSGFLAIGSNPGTFGFVFLAVVAGAVEVFVWRDDAEKGAGNFGDPLGLGQYDDEMRNRELNNGRMAMFAAAGIIVAELVTGKDGVQQLGLA